MRTCSKSFNTPFGNLLRNETYNIVNPNIHKNTSKKIAKDNHHNNTGVVLENLTINSDWKDVKEHLKNYYTKKGLSAEQIQND